MPERIIYAAGGVLRIVSILAIASQQYHKSQFLRNCI